MKIIQGNIKVQFDKQDIQDALVMYAKSNGVSVPEDASIDYTLTAGRGANPQHKAELLISNDGSVAIEPAKDEPEEQEAKPAPKDAPKKKKAESDTTKAVESNAPADVGSSLEDIFK